LKRPILIGSVVIYNRYDSYPQRLSYMNVVVFDNNDRQENRRQCGTLPYMLSINVITVTCSPPFYGQGVEIGRAGEHIISVVEVEVYEFNG